VPLVTFHDDSTLEPMLTPTSTLPTVTSTSTWKPTSSASPWMRQ